MGQEEIVDMQSKQSPERCSECGMLDVYPDVISYTARVRHDGSLYTFAVSNLQVCKCRSCDDVLFDNTTDEQISQGLREHLGLLSPQEIRRQLKRLGLTQKEFGERICVAAETISRWLSGTYIQSRASNKLMQLFFEREEEKSANPETGEVFLPEGELTTWNCSTCYQIEEMNRPELEAVGGSVSVVSESEAGMPSEMARGPPAREATLPCHA